MSAPGTLLLSQDQTSISILLLFFWTFDFADAPCSLARTVRICSCMLEHQAEASCVIQRLFPTSPSLTYFL